MSKKNANQRQALASEWSRRGLPIVIFYDHSSLENIHRHPTSHPSYKLFETKKGNTSVSFFLIVESTDLYSNPFLEDLERLGHVLK